jgi:branched-subunit amino acid transport protein
MCEVLAHLRVVFHACTCGLCRGVAAVAAALIGYDDVEVAVGTTTRRRWSWSTTSFTSTCNYVGSLLQLFFYYPVHLVVMNHDLLLTSILMWHGRRSASVANLYPISGIIAVLCSSWYGSCTIVICDGYKGLEWITICDQKISSCSLSVMCATCLYRLESPLGLTMHIVSRLSQQIEVICSDLLLINGIDLVKIRAF